METEKKRIGQLLVEEGYLRTEQLREGLAVQKKRGGRIGGILIDLGYLTEKTFLEFLAATPGIASVELPRCELDQTLLNLIPKEMAHRLEVVPIGKLRNLLTVAMVCPLDNIGQQELEEATGFKVKPVLCSKTAVQYVLGRYYNGGASQAEVDLTGLEQSLKLRRVAELIEQVEELPTLPDILNILAAVVHDLKSSASDVAKVISSDSALSAKILKLANSAAFGFSRKISNIQHAVTLLGLKETYGVALSALVVDQLVSVEHLNFRTYWNHAFRCATLSKLISGSVEKKGAESFFVAGLLHDMGKVVLAMSMRGKHERASACVSPIEQTTALEMEERILGITHAEVGYLVGEHWLLPAELTRAIRYHHVPELDMESQTFTATIFLANTFCRLSSSEIKQTTTFDGRITGLLAKLDLTTGAFHSVLSGFAKVADDINVF